MKSELTPTTPHFPHTKHYGERVKGELQPSCPYAVRYIGLREAATQHFGSRQIAERWLRSDPIIMLSLFIPWEYERWLKCLPKDPLEVDT